MAKQALGLHEEVMLCFKETCISETAKIDTGATRSSVDTSLVHKMGADSFVGEAEIRSANGITKRKIIKLKVKVAGRDFETCFSVADRSKMKDKVLIGQDILKNGFLVDPGI